MQSFSSFLTESSQQNEEEHEFNDISDPVQFGMPKALHDFLWHLTAPNWDGRGEGPEYSAKRPEGKLPLIESVTIFHNSSKYIIEAASASEKINADSSTPDKDADEYKHPLLATDEKHDLDNPHHPLNIVRRGIDEENKKIKTHNDVTDAIRARNKAKGFKGDAMDIRHPDYEHETSDYQKPKQRVSSGVDAAFKEKEIEDSDTSSAKEKAEAKATRLKKAEESSKHYRAFMTREGGASKTNKMNMLSQNGKTAKSKTVGRNTVGLALAPHTIGTVDPTGKHVIAAGHSNDNNACPKATESCSKNCLGLVAGGNRQYPVNSLKAKVLRQRYLTEHPEHAARLISHEIGENEKYADEHETIHGNDGKIVGTRNKKSGKVVANIGAGDESVPKKLTLPPKHVHDETKSAEENATLKAQKLKDREAAKPAVKENQQTRMVAKAKLTKQLHADIIHHTKNNTDKYHARPIESGARLNVTSDLEWHKMGHGKIMKHHPKTELYDYTKNHHVAMSNDLPKNYHVAFSHTGDKHDESNSGDAVKVLHKGGVLAMVYHRGKDVPKPKRVKVIGSKEGEHEWHVADGDSDDNIDQRHEAAAQHHEELSEKHKTLAKTATTSDKKEEHSNAAASHKKLAHEYRTKQHGVVSGLRLKGVKNEDVGAFANPVDKDGTIWIHNHNGEAPKHKVISIKSA